MFFEKRDLVLIAGITLVIIGLTPFMAPVYAVIIGFLLYFGIKVYGTASITKHAFVESKGGTAIDYKSQDFEMVMNTEEPGGVNMVIDPIGGNVTTRSLRLLKQGGRLVSTAMIQSMRRSLPEGPGSPTATVSFWFWPDKIA